MGPLHLKFGATITELSIFQTICLLSSKELTIINTRRLLCLVTVRLLCLDCTGYQVFADLILYIVQILSTSLQLVFR